MKGKKYLQRVISIFLACMMILNTPMAALASDMDLIIDAEAAGEVLPVSEETAEVPAAADEGISVSETEGLEEICADGYSDEYSEGDLLIEDGDALPDEELTETENAEEEEVPAETLTDADGILEDTIELGAEEVPGESTESKSVKVEVSISKAGEFVKGKDGYDVVYRTVELSGAEAYTISDVLEQAHDLFYDGGSAAGYGEAEGAYGLGLIKLWGDESGNFGYQKNDTLIPSGLSEPVADGDYIHAWIYQGSYPNMENYAYFLKKAVNAEAGKEVTLTLNEITYGEDYQPVSSGCEGASIYVNGVLRENVNTDNTGAAILTFDEPGTYKITAEKKKENGTTAITAAYCEVTVSEAQETETETETETEAVPPRFGTMDFFAKAQDYTDGKAPLTLTPEFDPEKLEGYEVVAPDYVGTQLYAVVESTEETKNNGNSYILMFSNNWGGWTGRGNGTQPTGSSADFSKGYTSIYFSNNATHARESEYRVNVVQYATLKGLELDGVTDAKFDPDTRTYHTYVDSNAEGAVITPTAFKTNYEISINGEAAENGIPYTLPYVWDDQGKMTAVITVSGPGKKATEYTVNLEKMPQEEAPFIMVHPTGADYIQEDITEEMTVVASASGKLAYQWYSNTEDSNEGGTEIDGATKAAYAPLSGVVGTQYYYCVVTNADTNVSSTTNTAKVTVDPDPTPIAKILNPGSAMPQDGRTYTWDKGYVYDLDAQDVTPLKVEATTPVGEEGVLSYQWYRVSNRPYHITGYADIQGATTTEAEFTPGTDIKAATEAGNYYGCKVTCTFKGKTYTDWASTGETYTEKNEDGTDGETYPVCAAYVYVKATEADTPVFTKQPLSAEYLEGDSAANLTVSVTTQDSGKKTYQWYVNDTESTEGAKELEGATTNSYKLGVVTEAGTSYYYCVVTNTLQGMSAETVSDFAKIRVKSLEDVLGDKLEGSGTAEDPYQLKTAEDLDTVAEVVAAGVGFKGLHLKLMNDVTLNNGWKPIGVTKDGTNNIQSGANLNAFSGNLDGNGKTITVPEGGLPLFGYVQNAEIRNLNIYGKQIAGYGLINNFEGVGLSGSAVVIDNVRLKSGTSTLKAGLLGANITTNGFAGCSAGFVATIRNCVIEEGVTIGYDGSQSMIGSIAGRMQGTVENCASYATVKGTSYVGGIIGTRDNAMGQCSVSGCKFYGSVEASGSQIGGIVGGGYSNSTAPNGGRIVITNCYSNGTITGSDKVGGIQGADAYVAQLWGTCSFKGNTFSGKVIAPEGASVGGVIGYYESMNKMDDISDNLYSSECGTDKGIGFVKYIDTSCTTHETESGATYFSTELNTDSCPAVSGCGWRAAHNRTDDPLGTDAYKLAQMENGEIPETVYVSELKLSGTYKTQYYMGEELDLTGLTVTAVWSNGDETVPEWKDLLIEGFDTSKRGEQTITLTYENTSTQIKVKVLKGAKITFSLLGDKKHDSDKDGSVHTLTAGNLETWVPETVYYVDLNATVYEVMQIAAKQYGFEIGARETQYGTYVESITMNGAKLAEMDNSPMSGWMYTVNGEHPDVGVTEKYVNDQDAIVFHYTDHYPDEHDHHWTTEWSFDEKAHWHECDDWCTITDNTQKDGYALHTSGDWIIDNAATGAKHKECTVCGYITETYTPHTCSWDNGTVTKQPTCTATGIKTYTCTGCGAKRTETIPALGHKFGAWTVASKATVFAAEVQTRTCAVCGAKETKNVGTKLKPTVKLSATKLPMKLKQTTTVLKVSGLANGDNVKSWKSSDTKIVKVDKNGKLTAQKKAGKATITVTLASGKTAKTTITVQKTTVKTTKISGLDAKVKLAQGKKLTLKPILTPLTSQEKITYSSSNKKVATVSSKGVVTAKKSGTAKIYVKSGKKKFTVTVTVPKIAPKEIKNVPKTKTIKKGKTYTLKPTLSPKGSEAKITYSSSNKKVATVNAKGKITAKKKGTATITVKAGKVTFKCKVTVK